MLEIV